MRREVEYGVQSTEYRIEYWIECWIECGALQGGLGVMLRLPAKCELLDQNGIIPQPRFATAKHLMPANHQFDE